MTKQATCTQKGLALALTAALGMSSLVALPATAHAASAPQKSQVTLELTAAKPKPVKIKALAGTDKGFTVKWAKGAKTLTGYQIRYSTDKAMKKGVKTITVKKYTSTSKAVNTKSADKVAKTYYVQMRTMEKQGKKTVYSAWSSSKTVTSLVCSGNATLDKQVADVLAKDVKATGETGLKAAFEYVTKLTYRANAATPTGDWKKWSVPLATEALKSKEGNCYQCASALAWLAKGLGYEAKAVAGTYTGGNGKVNPHGWAEVKIGSAWYILDADNQRTANKAGLDKDYFKLPATDERYAPAE